MRSIRQKCECHQSMTYRRIGGALGDTTTGSEECKIRQRDNLTQNMVPTESQPTLQEQKLWFWVSPTEARGQGRQFPCSAGQFPVRSTAFGWGLEEAQVLKWGSGQSTTSIIIPIQSIQMNKLKLEVNSSEGSRIQSSQIFLCRGVNEQTQSHWKKTGRI